MSYILALDQGTSSCRAIIFDKNAKIISSAQKAISQIYLKPGWIEQDPVEILTTQIDVIKIALKQKKINITDIIAIGITNQRETTVIWNKKTGKVIYKAIVWQDRRTYEFCRSHKKHAKIIQQKTGLLLDPYFSATKIQWILENVTNARKKAQNGELLFGTIDSWLIWNLTNRELHVTDPSNASRTLLFNIHTLNWDDELLTIFNIPKSLLPKVVNSSGNIGSIDKKFFKKALPICSIIGDQQAALFGHSCTGYGQVKCTYGTGSFLMMNTGEKLIKVKKHLLTTVAWSFPDFTHYAIEGSIFNAGTVLNWLIDELNLISSIKELEKALISTKDTGGVYFVSALTGLGAPHWNPNAKGVILGLSIQTKKAHLIKSAVDSIAYQVNDLISAFEKIIKKEISEIRVDGGLTKSAYLLQFQADISQRAIIRYSIDEVTALGAAFMAGIAINFWNFTEVKKILKKRIRYLPRINRESADKMLYSWDKALKIANKWEF